MLKFRRLCTTCLHNQSLLTTTTLPTTRLGQHRSYMNIPKDAKIYSDNGNKKTLARVVSIFGCGQLLIMGNMAYSSYDHLPAVFKWIPAEDRDKARPWRLPRATRSFRLKFVWATSILSGLFCIGCCVFSLRCVSSITLLKPGKEVLIQTYTPVVGSLRNNVVPVASVSAVGLNAARTDKTTQLIRLRTDRNLFKYLVYKSGQFHQPALFDRTVGVNKRLVKV